MVQFEENLQFLTILHATPGWGRQPQGGRGIQITDMANNDIFGVWWKVVLGAGERGVGKVTLF